MKCPQCQQESRSKAAYCSHCGAKLVPDGEPVYTKHVKKVSVFFFVLLAYIALLHATEFQKDFPTIVIADSVFALIIILFFIINFKEVKGLFNFKNLKPKILIIVFLSAVAMGFLVNVFADYLNKSLFDASQEIYFESYMDSPFPLLMCIISIGVVPAIFEEIAFRGILFTELQKITNTNAVILITSMLFTLLHFSVLSMIWLFPGALAMGYLRAKYNTINYGMLAHFTYNTTIVLLQIIFFK
jgi:membrane protease YdiL (CAAX protease family)